MNDNKRGTIDLTPKYIFGILLTGVMMILSCEKDTPCLSAGELQALEAEAGRGNSRAAMRLVRYYEGCVEDGFEQKRWLKVAADLKNEVAMYQYGEILFSSKDKNEQERGVHLLEAAATFTNNKYTQEAVADIYASRPEHAERAIHWYRAAAEAGNENAYILLGKMLYDRDRKNEARAWIIKSAELGQMDGLFLAGKILSEEGTPASRLQGVVYYRQSITKRNDPRSMYELGKILYRDENTRGEAVELLRKSAIMKNEDAIHFLSSNNINSQ